MATPTAHDGACTYALHGLCVRSEVPLDAPVVDASPHDIEIVWGERRVIADAAPDGELLSYLSPPDGDSWLVRGADGYVWRVQGACEFITDATRRHVRVHLAPDTEAELASLLAVTFLARMLVLDGHCVLHASAVEVDGSAIALVGHTGSGKTTLAALCCAVGTLLITDDALRVEPGDSGASCYSGSCELRLRPQAARFAELFEPQAQRTTLDGRTAVRPAHAEGVTFPLAALVAPRCVEALATIHVERLRGAVAALELMRFPRTLGWTDDAPAQHSLEILSELAASVPIYRADLPWSDDLGPQLASDLLAEVLAESAGVSGRRRR